MKRLIALLFALLLAAPAQAQTAAGQVDTFMGPSLGRQWVAPSQNPAPGYGTGVLTWLNTPSSANLAAAVTGETGTGALVFGTGPTISAPIVSGHPRVSGTAPVASACGTSPATVGSDLAGQVTMGTDTPTGCVLTFNAAFTSAPFCVVTWQTNLASMQYTVSTTAITLVQTATDSNIVNWHCIARSGG